ncbi:MAG: Hpt domain-containing protein, partial [Actinomycetes bacterium]
VLSLKTSGHMVGALQLAGLAWDLEQSVRRAATRSAPEAVLPGLAIKHLRWISRCAQRTEFQLQAVLP